MLRTTLVTLSLTLALAEATHAQSEPELTGNLPGRFSISVGGFLGADLDTKLRLDGTQGNLGTTIDLESLLGLKSSAQSFTGGITWRPHRRHQLSLSYYGIGRTNSKPLNRDITIGDSTWTLNTKVNSTFNTDYATLGYRWSPILTSRVSAGLTLVIPVVFVSTGLNVNASGAQAEVKRKEDVTVPVPLPGVHATFRLARQFWIDSRFQYLKLTVFGVTADVIDYVVGLHYYPFSHLGIAGGLAGNNMSISGEGDVLKGKITYDVLAVTLGLTYVP